MDITGGWNLNINRNQPLPISCSNCGAQFHKTIAELQSINYHKNVARGLVPRQRVPRTANTPNID